MTMINDDVSKELGNYMLRGYTLLDTVCPECQKVPMMRLRDQPMFCVACIDKPKPEQLKEEDLTLHEPSLLESFPQGPDTVQQQKGSSSRTNIETQQVQMNQSSQRKRESVYVKLADELESQLEDFLPIPHDESREVAFQQIERILQLIELTKNLQAKK
ncbi:Sjogren's syndrome/scleroderma autoantigen 1 family protein [Schizosaccharomyces octosporus yFS286]|uniref:Sjogren's syndrome/scleroderma autoantigen 1 family protein n=1 Tax=Schizosaccharomyces octosporus (strain yFS286) TaxID=483514 RepID=S9RBY7_SCHOY|nr:Sjogren's syndrome/scleroderma autoantigen 1 family protein [Schizosaccharomyces octosporus yFS286]EPX71624.1 Sjogren's syndrome/scleroderma autoantigen 1 family protein [Schizosaccharomyces octosporus yFS286]